MAITKDLYPNLPGILSEFKDGGLQLKADPNPPATDSVLILGTAVDGPIGEPVAVDPETVELVFGPALHPNGQPNGSTLVKGFEEAYMAGCRDIRLMRVTGEYATAELQGESYTKVYEKPYQEDMVLAVEGNQINDGIVDPAATPWKLNSEYVVESSVQVTVAGQPIAPSDFTVTQGSGGSTPVSATVHLNTADVASAGRAVYIQYEVADSTLTGTGELRAENGHTLSSGSVDYWRTHEKRQTVVLQDNPDTTTLKVYANGVEVEDDAYTYLGTTTNADGETVGEVQIHGAELTMGDIIDITYLSVVTEEHTPELKFKSVYGGRVYNDVAVDVEDINAGGSVIGKKVIVYKPDSKKAQDAEKPLEFNSIDFPNYDLMKNAINNHPRNNVVRVSVSEEYRYIETSKLDSSKPEVFLMGGQNGVNVQPYDLYEALGGKKDASGAVIKPGAYQLLENYNVDFIVPAGVYVDELLPGKYENFAHQLALACAVISHRNDTVIGVIPTKSPDEAGLASIRNHVDRLLKVRNDYFMRDKAGNVLRGSDGNPIDLGRFIDVIAGPDLILSSPRLGTYSSNSAAAYAGYMSTFDPESAPTNKAIPWVSGMRYNYSNAQLDKLTASRFVTYKFKNNGAQVAVTDAMTAAQPSSDYKRQNTVRVVKAVVDAIRRVSDPFIGEPNEVAQRNALSAAVDKELAGMKEQGVISDSNFLMVASPQDILLGQLKIELTIVPPQELRRITTVVSLKPSL